MAIDLDISQTCVHNRVNDRMQKIRLLENDLQGYCMESGTFLAQKRSMCAEVLPDMVALRGCGLVETW